MDKQFRTRWKDKPIRAIQISAGDPDWWLLGYAEEYGLQMPIYYTDLYKDSEVCQAYDIHEMNIEQFEVIFVLDVDGAVRYKDAVRDEISWETVYEQAEKLFDPVDPE